MRIILNKRNDHALTGIQCFYCRHAALVLSGRRLALMMPSPELWAGALSLILIHDESGCPHSALNAARILDRLCATPEIDEDTRALCERASNRLIQAEYRQAR